MVEIRHPSGARLAASAATQSQRASPMVVSAVTSSWSSPMSRSFIAPSCRVLRARELRPSAYADRGAARAMESGHAGTGRACRSARELRAAAAPVVDDGLELGLAPDDLDRAG